MFSWHKFTGLSPLKKVRKIAILIAIDSMTPLSHVHFNCAPIKISLWLRSGNNWPFPMTTSISSGPPGRGDNQHLPEAQGGRNEPAGRCPVDIQRKLNIRILCMCVLQHNSSKFTTYYIGLAAKWRSPELSPRLSIPERRHPQVRDTVSLSFVCVVRAQLSHERSDNIYRAFADVVFDKVSQPGLLRYKDVWKKTPNR